MMASFELRLEVRRANKMEGRQRAVTIQQALHCCSARQRVRTHSAGSQSWQRSHPEERLIGLSSFLKAMKAVAGLEGKAGRMLTGL